ncbi:TonB-dependent receptor [Sphingomonas glacialis]|uniref:TonB-dependent receptor n=1 Tax=Sphingomonas glacialis TaxID=658225 RepID=A0ABQ3LJ96_9SPHN|nr:TonB-dependent receptor [Sphingomonas glacialis]GHH14768.1 TonB-dependent receptor [Sphingomonas glacialis]
MNIKKLMGATALVGVLAAFPSIALAQTAPVGTTTDAGQADDQDAASNKEIIVTGSRISRPNDNSSVPISSVSAQELRQTAQVSIGDVLNDLPQLQSTFSQSNSTRFLGTAGLNLLDLRGLGTQRTLVLVNGRRHVGSDVLSNAVSPDTNTFPTDLIERVDVVTGGNSAVYGSDALAGVVNFVLKDHFQGLQVRGQGGISQYGDAGTYYGSVLAGKNFADGRGNIAIDLEYARQNILYASDRTRLRTASGFVTVDTDQPGLGTTQPNLTINNDGNPDASFFHDIRSSTISDGGLVSFAGPLSATATAPCGRDKDGRAFTCNFLFQPDGTLVAQTGTRVGISGGSATGPSATPAGSFIGGNGNTRREGELVQITPALNRYSANLIGHFEVSPAFVPFIEAKYVRTDSYGQGGSGPAFFTGSTIGGLYERPRLDNPYLSAQARGVIAAQALASIANGQSPTTGAAISAATAATLTTQVNNGSYRFILRKNLTDLGVRSEQAKRETYRFVGGVKGVFNKDWNYEVSVNYGEFDEKTKVLGNVNVQRELLALDTTRNAAGQIVCAAQIDPTRAIDYGNVPNQTTLNADIAACQPLNPFGLGSPSAAAKNYILQNTISSGKITQLDINAFVGGNTGQFFNLPGGPVGFAVGGEYRRETAYYRQDPLVENGYTFYNSIPVFNPTAFEVKEAYGELRLPFLKNLPFAESLEVDAAGRISNYKGSAGTTYTYNVGGDWAPISDIRFRVQYARSVRAPNLSDLYSPQSQNFAPGFGDPCSAVNIASGTQYRAANCTAAGIPTGGANPYNFQYSQSLQIVSGGNPNLSPETSDSYTYGVVLKPRFVPGLTISVDYYKIRVNNVITAPSAQGIVNSCYDSPTTNNQFCALFKRDNASGAVTGNPFRIIEGSLQQTVLNYAKLAVSGIDVDVAYSHKFGDVTLGAHAVYTHATQKNSYTDPTQPGFADTTLGELGAPRDAANLTLTSDFGPVFASYEIRYLSKQSVGAIENHETFQGREPQNLDDFTTPFYPDVVYMNARLGFNVKGGSNFYFGVDNLTNQAPPLGSTGIGAGSGIFEPIGRRFYAGFTAKF